jgi:hypothetical protein
VDIATDSNLIGGAALGDGPTGICHLLNAAHLIVSLCHMKFLDN